MMAKSTVRKIVAPMANSTSAAPRSLSRRRVPSVVLFFMRRSLIFVSLGLEEKMVRRGGRADVDVERDGTVRYSAEIEERLILKVDDLDAHAVRISGRAAAAGDAHVAARQPVNDRRAAATRVGVAIDDETCSVRLLRRSEGLAHEIARAAACRFVERRVGVEEVAELGDAGKEHEHDGQHERQLDELRAAFAAREADKAQAEPLSQHRRLASSLVEHRDGHLHARVRAVRIVAAAADDERLLHILGVKVAARTVAHLRAQEEETEAMEAHDAAPLIEFALLDERNDDEAAIRDACVLRRLEVA